MEWQSTVEHMKTWRVMNPSDQARVHSAVYEACLTLSNSVTRCEKSLKNIMVATHGAAVHFLVHKDSVTVNNTVIEDAPGQLLGFAAIMEHGISWSGLFFWAFHGTVHRDRRYRLNSQLAKILNEAAPGADIAIVNTKKKPKNEESDVSTFALTWSRTAKVESNVFNAHSLYEEATSLHAASDTAAAVEKILAAISKCDLVPKQYVLLARCLNETGGLQAVKRVGVKRMSSVMAGIGHCMSWLARLTRGLTRDSIPPQEREQIKQECLPQLKFYIEQLQALEQILRHLPELSQIAEQNPLNTVIQAVANLLDAGRPISLLLELIGSKCQRGCDNIFTLAVDLIDPNRHDPSITCQHLWPVLIYIAEADRLYRFPDPYQAPTDWQERSAIHLKREYFEQISSGSHRRFSSIDVEKLPDQNHSTGDTM